MDLSYRKNIVNNHNLKNLDTYNEQIISNYKAVIR